MINYKKQLLNKYGSDKTTINYLNQFWTDPKGLEGWDRRKNDFPNEKHETINEIGGLVFTKEEFLQMKKFMVDCGDTYFILIEDNPKSDIIISLKFPVAITWKEMTNGGWLSYEIFERPIKRYYLFGDSKKWFRTIDNDEELPVQVTTVELNEIDNYKKLLLKQN